LKDYELEDYTSEELTVIYQNIDDKRLRDSIFKVLSERFKPYYFKALHSIPQYRWNTKDFLQHCLIETYERVLSFDLSRGVKFKSHLAWGLRKVISRWCVYHANLIRPDSHWSEKVKKGTFKPEEFPTFINLEVYQNEYES